MDPTPEPRRCGGPERTSRPRPLEAAGGPSVPQADRGRPEAWGERILAGQRTERDRDLSTPRTAKLLAENVAVGFRCSRRDPETTCEFLVRTACGDQFDYAIAVVTGVKCKSDPRIGAQLVCIEEFGLVELL